MVDALQFQQLAILIEKLTESFESAVPSTFAQQHLVNGPCFTAWQNGDLVTYDQDGWGSLGTTASNPLNNDFFTVFAVSGGFEIGLSGTVGNSAFVGSADAVLDYLPANGLPAALDNDSADPISTSAGIFGGWQTALQLNVSFGDAGYLGATSGLTFGDLRLCGLVATPLYTGMTVRQFLAAMNTAIGGGSAAYSFDDMANLTYDVSAAFEGGTPSAFAQQHLVNGVCGS